MTATVQVLILGNSHVQWAQFFNGRIQVKELWTKSQFLDNKSFFSKIEKDSEKILISVNPELEEHFASELEIFWKAKLSEILRFKTSYSDPSSLGQDRWVGALGALRLYPGRDLAILDFGTALTLNVVQKEGLFLGGFILPSLYLELKALNEHTAQLPLASFKNFKELYAQNTLEALGGGVYQMRVRALKSWLSDLKKRFPQILVVATGGEARLFEPYGLFDVMNEELLFWGALEALERRE